MIFISLIRFSCQLQLPSNKPDKLSQALHEMNVLVSFLHIAHRWDANPVDTVKTYQANLQKNLACENTVGAGIACLKYFACITHRTSKAILIFVADLLGLL